MEQETVSIEDLMTILESINQFDTVVIASLMSGYLLMFVIGYSTGMVAKILKRA